MARRTYVKEFGVVEIQESFYNVPRRSTVERWRASVPQDFEFILKAPQLITHAPASPTYRRLKIALTEQQKTRYGFFRPTAEVRDVWRQTLEFSKILQSRIVLFQSPASFSPIAEHIKNLTRFFEIIPRGGLRVAWEPRGPWPPAKLKSLCRSLDLIHCVDPLQASSIWGSPAYFRLHGKGGYRYDYSEAELNLLRGIVEPAPFAYVLFNNSKMWDNAGTFADMMKSEK